MCCGRYMCFTDHHKNNDVAVVPEFTWTQGVFALFPYAATDFTTRCDIVSVCDAILRQNRIV